MTQLEEAIKQAEAERRSSVVPLTIFDLCQFIRADEFLRNPHVTPTYGCRCSRCTFSEGRQARRSWLDKKRGFTTAWVTRLEKC